MGTPQKAWQQDWECTSQCSNEPAVQFQRPMVAKKRYKLRRVRYDTGMGKTHDNVVTGILRYRYEFQIAVPGQHCTLFHSVMGMLGTRISVR